MSSPPSASSSVLPTGGGRALPSPEDMQLLLLDHQGGLFQTAKGVSVADLRRNTTKPAKLGEPLKVPMTTMASEPGGRNGPPMANVYAMMDVSGVPSDMVSRTTFARIEQVGVVPTTTHVGLSEVCRTWKRPVPPSWRNGAPSWHRTTPTSWRAPEDAGRRRVIKVTSRHAIAGVRPSLLLEKRS